MNHIINYPNKTFCSVLILFLFSSFAYADDWMSFTFVNHYHHQAVFYFPYCYRCDHYFLNPGESVSGSINGSVYLKVGTTDDSVVRCSGYTPYEDFVVTLGESGWCIDGPHH